MSFNPNANLLESAQVSLVDGYVGPALYAAGSEVLISDGLALIKNRSTCYWFNGVFRMNNHLSAEDVLDRAAKFMIGRDYQVFVRDGVDNDLDELCRNSEFELDSNRQPYMVVNKRVDQSDLPSWLTIDSAPSVKLASDFTDIGIAGFCKDEDTERGTREMLVAKEIFTPISQYFVGYVDGEPAASVCFWISRAMAGVYWVATKPEFRRRGIAEIMTRHATNVAFDSGVGAVTLQASAMGRGVYERIGYRTVGVYNSYKVKA